jgi:hypothetical protein
MLLVGTEEPFFKVAPDTVKLLPHGTFVALECLDHLQTFFAVIWCSACRCLFSGEGSDSEIVHRYHRPRMPVLSVC